MSNENGELTSSSGRVLRLSKDKGTKYSKHYSKTSSSKYKEATSSVYAKPKGGFSSVALNKPIKYYTGLSIPWWIWLIAGILLLLIIILIISLSK